MRRLLFRTPSSRMPDLLASLRRDPVRIERGGVVRYFRNAPVREWIELDSMKSAALVFVAEDRARWLRDVASARVSGKDVEGWSFDLVKKLTGWNWWEAASLLNSSGQRAVLGRLVLAGVDPGTVTLGPWCAAVWAVLTEHADAKQIQRLETELSLPPEGYEDAWDDDEEYYAAMLAQSGRFGSQGVSSGH